MKKTREQKNHELEVKTQEHFDAAKAMVEPYWIYVTNANLLEENMLEVRDHIPWNPEAYENLRLARDWELQKADDLHNAMFKHKRIGEKILKKTEPKWWRR